MNHFDGWYSRDCTVESGSLYWLNRTVFTRDPVDFWAILLRYHIWTYMLCWIGWKSTFYKFHPCLPQYHTKRVIVDISLQSSDYSTKFMQYRLRKVFTGGESKMTNVTFSYCITTYRAMTNTLSYAIKIMQQLCDLKIYSSEEPAKTVQWQNVKSVELTPPYMTSGVT